MSPVNNADAFDYQTLPADLAAEACVAADRIHDLDRTITAAIFEIGDSLIAMKERLGHGHFGTWIKAEFAMSDRKAERLMRAARKLTGEARHVVSILSTTALYELAAPTTPEKVFNETGSPDDLFKTAR